jgi:hypothetical protein
MNRYLGGGVKVPILSLKQGRYVGKKDKIPAKTV